MLFNLIHKLHFLFKESDDDDDDEEPLLYTREAQPLSPNISFKTNFPSGKVDHATDPASPSDSGLFLVSPEGQMSNASSPSDGDQVCCLITMIYDKTKILEITMITILAIIPGLKRWQKL